MSRPSLSSRAPRQGELDWNSILVRAKAIVESYDTGVTLRQLYYRLVSEGLFPNRQQSYKTLSSKTAQARREGWFPSLIDRTRDIERYRSFDDPADSLSWLQGVYMRNRTEGQEWSIYIGVEKHGMTVQLVDWFGELGIPVIALGGYSSQTFVDVVRADVEDQDRKSVLLYAGDFDPSGMDIDRDFCQRGNCFDETIRVALKQEHLKEYDLPPMPGKSTDARAWQFIKKYGELIQVELDALDPSDLRNLYQKSLDEFWDAEAYKATLRLESEERVVLAELVGLSDLTSIGRAERTISALDSEEDAELAVHVATERLKALRNGK